MLHFTPSLYPCSTGGHDRTCTSAQCINAGTAAALTCYSTRHNKVLLQVPCVAVVENMSYFDVDGVRHLPFGAGSGDRIVRDFGLPNLIRFPIVADLSLAGDGDTPAHLPY